MTGKNVDPEPLNGKRRDEYTPVYSGFSYSDVATAVQLLREKLRENIAEWSMDKMTADEEHELQEMVGESIDEAFPDLDEVSENDE